MPDPLTTLAVTALLTAGALLLFWPERGLVVRWRSMRQVSERVLTEDAVKHIHKYESINRWATLESVAGSLGLSTEAAAELMEELTAHGLARLETDHFKLTPNGRDYALQIIRAHRLWERYLADETGFAETEWHALAERQEHALSPADADALEARLGHPTHDPHGDPIPTAEGELVPHGGVPLTAMAVDTALRIVHVEDEPANVYAQLVAEGLRPGMIGRTTEISPNRVRLWAEGDEHLLAPVVAANVFAVALPEEPRDAADTERLSDLEPGERGTVVRITRASRGAERRRLLDLGVLPGTVIETEFSSPTGDPVAYRIRGATIALRHVQADAILITRLEEHAT